MKLKKGKRYFCIKDDDYSKLEYKDTKKTIGGTFYPEEFNIMTFTNGFGKEVCIKSMEDIFETEVEAKLTLKIRKTEYKLSKLVDKLTGIKL